jgi:D-serine deaminase-like pyridoxal phosphate-dependent protein
MEEADDNVEATKVPPMKMAALSELKTPFLTIIRDVAERNCKQMQAIAHANSVSLRPHVKTHKTIQGLLQ